jgi:hypothetical protein
VIFSSSNDISSSSRWLYKPISNGRPHRLEPRRGESDCGMVLFTLDLDPTVTAYAIQQQLTGWNGKPSRSSAGDDDHTPRRRARSAALRGVCDVWGRLERKLSLSMRKANLSQPLACRFDGIHLAPFEQGEIGPDLFRHAA